MTRKAQRMQCRQCGIELPDTVRFCPACGAKAPDIADQPIPTVYGPQPIPISQPLGMKWFKFVIYAQLFLSALLSLATAFMYATGYQYTAAGGLAWPDLRRLPRAPCG